MKNKRVYLIGFMGAGKTTTGKKVASLLGWEFVDLDDVVEQISGKSITQLFSEEGEDRFRKIETEALIGLSDKPKCIISTGGGTPCFHDNMDYMLGSGLVVYIKMTPGQLKSRLEKSKAERPLLRDVDDSELLGIIKKKLDEREQWYMKADLVIDGMDINYNLATASIRDLL